MYLNRFLIPLMDKCMTYGQFYLINEHNINAHLNAFDLFLFRVMSPRYIKQYAKNIKRLLISLKKAFIKIGWIVLTFVVKNL